MKKRYSKWLIVANLAAVLFFFNYSVRQKEIILKEGQLVLLELAPVDPRSLMQGDYMELRYRIAEDIDAAELPARGFLVVKLDSVGVAHRVRLQPEREPLAPGEYLIAYHRTGKWNFYIGAESFFFQEGKASVYEAARYGGLRLDQKGGSVLTGLYDQHRKEIK